MKQNWTQTLTIIAGFLPLIIGLGAWALSNSNRTAVMESEVQAQKASAHENEERIEKLEIELAAERCHETSR